MIHILTEENYLNNNRFHQLFDGISSVSKKKHLEITVYKEVFELPKDCRAVILICQSLKWSTDRIEELNKRDIHPLVFGFQYLDTMYKYSSIAPNYTKSSYRLTKFILSESAGKTAIVGYNEDSLPDRLKYIGIRYAVNEEKQPYEVFKNNGDVLACLEHFASSCEDVKNIVCCNDNVAIALYTKYPHLLKDRKMCSCSGLKISEYFENQYPVCRIDYYNAGIQLAMLYLFLIKEEVIYSTVMTFDVEFSGDKADLIPAFPAKTEVYSHAEVDFYGDKNLTRMENLDRMLTTCDETDFIILREITDNNTYESIAEKYYLAVNTIKYRMKKMLETACVGSRKELLAFLEEYGVKFKK